MRSSLTKLAAALLAGVFVMAAASDVDARSRARSGTWAGSGDKSGAWSQSVTRERGRSLRSTTVTGENGRSASRDVDRAWDREAGAASSTITSTGPNGKTRIVNQDTLRNEDGSWTTERTASGTGGYAASGSRTVTPYGGGERGVAGSYANSRGADVDWSGSITRTEDGVARGGVYTNNNTGGQGSYAATRTRAEGGVAREQSVTTEGGATWSREAMGVWDPETRTYSRDIAVTNPNGETRTRGAGITVD